MVGNDTLARPGGDAAVVRVHGTQKALAISTDCNPRYCEANPVEGGKQAVVETWRNIVSTGARPLAITNCLNFGNPEKPEVMGQIVGCLQGMGEACRGLDYPIISGNVSLYNDTEGKSILPTPAIGGVGILKDVDARVGNRFVVEGEAILLIGETKGHLSQSQYQRYILGKEEGEVPPVDVALERKHGEFILTQIAAQKITACHDISDGGLLVALAEMCMPKHGATITLPEGMPTAIAFGEDQARYVITVKIADAEAVMKQARVEGIPCVKLGVTGGKSLSIVGHGDVMVADLFAAHERWLPEYMC
jgi:phosphoribosylformylglycinamidine synthase